jgi:hypothetical protein
MRHSIQDRLQSLRSQFDILISEARLDYESKQIEADRARAALVDAEMAGARMNAHARAARRPRHHMPNEGEEEP